MKLLNSSARLCVPAILGGLFVCALIGNGSQAFAAGVTSLPIADANRVDRTQPLTPLADDSLQKTEQWVTVEGRAEMTSGRSVARKQALLDAYRQAINAGGSIEIGEFSQLRNFKEVVDLVTKRVHGYIKGYEILAEGPDSKDKNIYMVAIRALVVDGLDQLSAGDEGLKQFVALIGSPKVLFVLATEAERTLDTTAAGYTASQNEQIDLEVVQGDTQVRLHRDQNSADSMGMNDQPNDIEDFQVSSAEQEMANHFRQVGYEVLTSDDVLNSGFIEMEDLRLARKGLGAYAAKIGRVVNADIVISGVVKYRVSAVNGNTDIGAHLGTVNLTSKAILPGSGRVLHVSTNRQKYMSVQTSSALMAREESLARASQIAADELKWEVPKLLAQETRDIEVTLSNISYDQSNNVRLFLNQLAGIDSVYMAGWKDKQSKYTVKCIYTGPREHDLVESLQNKFKQLNITELGNYQIVAGF